MGTEFQLERVLRAIHGRRGRVLHLDPVWRPSGAIGAIQVLRNKALEAHQAGMAEQVGAPIILRSWAALLIGVSPRSSPAFSAGEPLAISAISAP